jgi:hypothetical protein
MASRAGSAPWSGSASRQDCRSRPVHRPGRRGRRVTRAGATAARCSRRDHPAYPPVDQVAVPDRLTGLREDVVGVVVSGMVERRVANRIAGSEATVLEPIDADLLRSDEDERGVLTRDLEVALCPVRAAIHGPADVEPLDVHGAPELLLGRVDDHAGREGGRGRIGENGVPLAIRRERRRRRVRMRITGDEELRRVVADGVDVDDPSLISGIPPPPVAGVTLGLSAAAVAGRTAATWAAATSSAPSMSRNAIEELACCIGRSPAPFSVRRRSRLHTEATKGVADRLGSLQASRPRRRKAFASSDRGDPGPGQRGLVTAMVASRRSDSVSLGWKKTRWRIDSHTERGRA